MCFGTAGLDPALEGFSKEGLQILLSGDGSTGAAAGGAGELDEEIPSPLRGPPSSVKGFDRSGSAAGAGWQGSASAGAGAGTEVNNGGVSSLENGGGGHAGGGVQGGNGMDTSDFDVDSIGDPEVCQVGGGGRDGDGGELLPLCRDYLVLANWVILLFLERNVAVYGVAENRACREIHK